MDTPSEGSRICSDLRFRHQCTEWSDSTEASALDQGSDHTARTVAIEELNPMEIYYPDQLPVCCSVELAITV